MKIGHLQAGDIIMVNHEGLMREGTVVQTNREEHMALVDNGIQAFWYPQQDLFPVALNEDQLHKFGFEAEDMNGSVKYKKGAFRMLLPEKGNFSKVEMWYREDRRHFEIPIAVHELQNLHASMTKVPLERH
ncbi:MAG: hypothetical protein GC171_12605 [Terrimonas sp.]|nr:hypothetical protein [Terrimonas sp.]